MWRLWLVVAVMGCGGPVVVETDAGAPACEPHAPFCSASRTRLVTCDGGVVVELKCMSPCQDNAINDCGW